MKLGEFIKNFSHNNMVRLHYQNEDSSYTCVLSCHNEVSMDWEILEAKGPNRHYINNEVIKIIGIYYRDNPYSDAINIVIEKLENQPNINENINEKECYEKTIYG